MKPRHVCESFKCLLCFPATAKAFEEGLKHSEAEAEKFYLEVQALRAEVLAMRALEEAARSFAVVKCACPVPATIHFCHICIFQRALAELDRVRSGE